MHRSSSPTSFRNALVVVIGSLPLLLGACTTEWRIGGHGSATSLTVYGDGDTTLSIRRHGYALRMVSEGVVSFTEDESDVSALEPRGKFALREELDGVERQYVVKADRSGSLTRVYSLEGEAMPMDDAGRAWLAAALPRMFRESGYDAEARVARLLAQGGPDKVLAEVALISSDYARASYLGKLLKSTELSAEQAEHALNCAAGIGSDYELGRALGLALSTQSLPTPLIVRLLETAEQVDSDYELAKLLRQAVERLPADAAARDAWLATARHIGSDYELARTLEAALQQSGTDADFAAAVASLAQASVGSDYELGQVLKSLADRSVDPALAAAYLDAVGAIASDYERRVALERVAAQVAPHEDLNRRYRQLARDMSSYERGHALQALDDATEDAR